VTVTRGRSALLQLAGSPPLFAPVPSRSAGWRTVGLGTAALLAGTVIGLLRQPGDAATNTVWAEDGEIFLGAAATDGPVRAIATSYAGYYHLVPRLLSGIAALAPSSAAAWVLAVSAALCAAAVAVLVYVASAAYLPSPVSRFLVSAVVVVVPLAQDDVLNSIANLHWYGLYAVFWVLLWAPRSRLGRAVGPTVTLLVAASDILTVAFIPLALWRALRGSPGRRLDRHGTILAAALGVGLAAQFAGLLSGASSRSLTLDALTAFGGYVLRAVPAGVLGERWVGTQTSARGVAFAAVAWLLIGVAVLMARSRLVRPHWPLAITAAAHSLVLYVLPVFLSGAPTPRYAVAPALLMVTALVAVLRPADPPVSRRAAMAPVVALAALMITVCAVNLRVDNRRAHGPSWSTEVGRARATCATARPATDLDLPIAPRDAGGWHATLPCSYLRR
jgi:hypothetical protein